MENQLQKNESDAVLKADEYRQHTGMVETVRKTIFPNSTNEELQLYFYQCAVSGVHPLSKKIIPIKFKDADGGKVSFITTVDHARSKAESSGLYDGQDPVEFEGELEVDGIIVPERAVCRVYKKDVSRPFVGEACWTEFYPGPIRGRQYLKMPRIMLGKCAEMQAMRRAFPDQLHSLYSEEEMLNVIENMADTSSKGTKPAVSESDVSFEDGESGDMPTEEQIKKFSLINTKQAGLLYGKCKSQKVDPESIAAFCKIKNIHWITWRKTDPKCFEKILKTVEDKPEFFKKYEKQPEPTKAPEAPQEPEVMGAEDFVGLAVSAAKSVGLSQDKAEILVDMEFGFKTFADVPADQQSKVIDFLSAQQEQAGA